MLTKIKVNEIEKSMSGVKFAHFNLHIDITGDVSNYAISNWEIQCTSMALVIKGSHNSYSLKWFLDKLNEDDLESKICSFARDVINADDLINKEKTLVYKTPARKKAPAKKRVI